MEKDEDKEYIKFCKEKETSLFVDIKYHERQAQQLRQKHWEVLWSIMHHVWKIDIGDIIVDNHGKKHKIVSIRVGQSNNVEYVVKNRPWITGNPMRQDGTFGTAVRNLTDSWKRLDEIPEVKK